MQHLGRNKDGMIEGRLFSARFFPLPMPTIASVASALILLSITSTATFADVEVDLSAIGLRTETDERIAPGRAPVQLRLPSSASETRILLTPPPGVDRAARSPAPAPVVLAPADSQSLPVLPIVRAPTPPASRPGRPERQERQERPVEQAALPTATNITPTPVQPVERAPVQEAILSTPTQTPSTTTPSAPSNTQVASLPAPNAASHHLRFEADVATIPGQTRAELELVAAELMRHSDRIEIQAFAGAPNGLTSEARRLSLKRAIAVRKFLISQGVLQSRIDLRAMGGVRDNGPTERVDIILSSR